MRPSRTLITGGAGFLGSHLAERLHAGGDRVVVLDDLSTGRRANLAALEGRPGFRFVRGSITDAELVGELAADCERVFHLAAVVGVRLVLAEPVRTLETNVHGTEVVLRAAAERRLPVVLASSSEVYGKGTRVPFREDDDLLLGATTRRRWTYACSKATDECLGLALARDHGLPVVAARFFNTVGPRQVARYGMVLPTFVDQALAGEPLTVHGTGAQTRSFCHVRDTVEALVRLARRPVPRGGLVVNVGHDEEVSMLELARRVRAAAGSASPIVRVPYGEVHGEGFEDVQRRVPALERLAAHTGWRPSIPLERILSDVVAARRAERASDGVAGGGPPAARVTDRARA